MAGAKETPRQKMVGMMYLVLTAMLALNVSKDILKSFVAIEENIQKGNVYQNERGSNFIAAVKAEYSTSKGDIEGEKRILLGRTLVQMEQIDSITAELIAFIDDLKIQILAEAKEDVSSVKDNDENTIVWSKGHGTLPMVLNLNAVEGQDKYDEPMRVMGVHEDLKSPNGNGLELWSRLLKFRQHIVGNISTYAWNGQSYSLKVVDINSFKNRADLVKQVNKWLESSPDFNKNEDFQSVADVYMLLSKPERVDVKDVKGLHWIGATFDHAPLVASIASLSSLQQDILAARASALATLASRVNMDSYGFNKIQSLAYGPLMANQGDSVYLQVMMAAYDEYNQPIVDVSSHNNVNIQYPQNGQAIIGLRVNSSTEEILKGRVGIANKAGVIKYMDWEHAVKVLKPSGALSLPKMNILYRGIDNEINAVASGYDKVLVTGTDVTISNSGKVWIARVGNAKTAQVTLYGENSVTGKREKLVTQDYVIKNVPDPVIYWGAAKDGETANVMENKLFAKVNPEFPLNVTYRILNWELSVAGMNAPPIKGSGSSLSTEALTFLKQVRRGMTVVIRTTVELPTKVSSKNTAVFTI